MPYSFLYIYLLNGFCKPICTMWNYKSRCAWNCSVLIIEEVLLLEKKEADMRAHNVISSFYQAKLKIGLLFFHIVHQNKDLALTKSLPSFRHLNLSLFHKLLLQVMKNTKSNRNKNHIFAGHLSFKGFLDISSMRPSHHLSATSFC